MGVKTTLRLHFSDGRVVTERIEKLARENGTNVAGARELVAQWVTAGDLREREDGGYDVIRYRPRKLARRTPTRPAGRR